MKRSTRLRAVALTLAGAVSLSHAAEPPQRLDAVGAAGVVPALADMQASPQQMAPMVQRFLRDLESVQHVQDVAWGRRRAAALDALYNGWLARLEEVDYAALTLEDRIDWQLLARDLRQRSAELEFEQRRFREAAPLLPGVEALIALAEARRQLELADARGSAETLERGRRQLADAMSRLKAPAASTKRPSRHAAMRWTGPMKLPGPPPTRPSRRAGCAIRLARAPRRPPQ